MKVYPAEGQMQLLDDLPGRSGKGRKIKFVDEKVILKPNYVYVQTTEQIEMLAAEIQLNDVIVADIESRDTDWMRSKAVALNIYTPSNGKAYFIPNRMVHAVRNFDDGDMLHYFSEAMSDPAVGKIGHNFKFDMHFMRETWGIEVVGVHHDTQIASILLNENEAHDLEALCAKYLKTPHWKQSHGRPFDTWPIPQAVMYGCRDAENTWFLYKFQNDHLKRLPKLWALNYDIETPVIEITYKMEKQGVHFDNEYNLAVLQPTLTENINQFRGLIHAKTGTDVNIDSPDQLSKALFDMLEMPKIDEYHTNEPVLTELVRRGYPLAQHVLNYRKWETIRSMFGNKLPDHVINGCIYCTFNTMGTVTGRMSCKNPNLQQLPKRIGPIVRRAIIPSPGCVFVSMDYNQMELRMLAHFSGDPGLLKAYDEGQDIHTAVMCGVLGISYEDYERDPNKPEYQAARVKAKTVNFGVLYGMGPSKLAARLSILLFEAKDFIAKYFARYPGIRRFKNQCARHAYDQGYVETVLGRKRRLPDAKSPNSIKSSAADREAVNAPIQGSVADMVKLTMIKHNKYIVGERLPYKLLLNIHDEIIYEVPKAWLQKNLDTLDNLKRIMENVVPLKVKIVVNLDILERWGDKIILDEEELDAEVV